MAKKATTARVARPIAKINSFVESEAGFLGRGVGVGLGCGVADGEGNAVSVAIGRLDTGVSGVEVPSGREVGIAE